MASWIRGKLLGAGAFGSVNLAIDREDGAVFAVKSVAMEANSEVAMRAIENEITLLQSFDSQFVVNCLGSDWTEENGESIRNVFLEYMPEGCLTDFVNQFARSGTLDEHLVRTYTRSIVQGIDYLHSRGIVHCDIKGKNILVGNGNVKLTDFGSAKRVGECDEGGSVNGTPLWMAPEVVRQAEQGPASDIWSLGCTVVEMATGRAPWNNLTGMDKFVALYHIGCTDALPAVPAWLSPEAHDFLSHCFERDPRRRWTSTELLQHPFLTTRFLKKASSESPRSPTSVMNLPDDDDGDCDCQNSVPTLAAPPSLFKRKASLEQSITSVPEHYWSCRPDSGPWIVVRSPKTSTPVFDQPEDLETMVEQKSVSAWSRDEAVSSSHAPDELNVLELELDCHRKECGHVRWFVDESSVNSLSFGLVCEYSVSVNQYSYSQILLYWWHRRRSNLPNCCGLSFHCVLQLLDEYKRLKKPTIFAIVCVVCVALSCNAPDELNALELELHYDGKERGHIRWFVDESSVNSLSFGLVCESLIPVSQYSEILLYWWHKRRGLVYHIVGTFVVFHSSVCYNYWMNLCTIEKTNHLRNYCVLCVRDIC